MIPYSLTDKQLTALFGTKIKQWRIERNLSQKELSERSGVSLFTISNIEKGNSCSLLTLLQILRALEKLELLNDFFTEAPISPVSYAKFLEKQHTPKRVRKTKKENNKTESEW